MRAGNWLVGAMMKTTHDTNSTNKMRLKRVMSVIHG
jgi:hypothetical protein